MRSLLLRGACFLCLNCFGATVKDYGGLRCSLSVVSGSLPLSAWRALASDSQAGEDHCVQAFPSSVPAGTLLYSVTPLHRPSAPSVRVCSVPLECGSSSLRGSVAAGPQLPVGQDQPTKRWCECKGDQGNCLCAGPGRELLGADFSPIGAVSLGTGFRTCLGRLRTRDSAAGGSRPLHRGCLGVHSAGPVGLLSR